jgi:predicted acyltransferase
MGEFDATPIPDEQRFHRDVKAAETAPEPKVPEPVALAPSVPHAPFSPKLKTAALVPEKPAGPARLVSLDAFRGFVMLLMASSALAIPELVNTPKTEPPPRFERAGRPMGNDPTWQAVADQLDHREWIGCAVWDMIQPCFMFMVGVAMPYSLASRKARGEKDAHLILHTVWRSFVLVALAVFLSIDSRDSSFVFTNVLAQIGLGYTFVFIIQHWAKWMQWVALATILGGYWLFCVAWPVPGAGPNVNAGDIEGKIDQSVQNVANMVEHPENLGAFARIGAHWRFNANAPAEVDKWFLNLFPREKAFTANKGGYATLNFIPSMATMLLGVIAGQWLRSPRSAFSKLQLLVITGVLCAALGLAWGAGPDGLWSQDSLCPIVKRIWTPSWALFSGGLAFILLAGFYLVVDVIGFKSWTFPLVVVGMNSIAIYCMSQLFRGWLHSKFSSHLASAYQQKWARANLGEAFYQDVYSYPNQWLKDSNYAFKGLYGPIIDSAMILLVFWLVCLWMYRRKIFLKI